MTDNDKDSPDTASGAATAPTPYLPWWHWRQLTRGRLRPALAAAVAGALLGGMAVSWQTGAGPFADDRACWGALGKHDVAALFGGKTDIETYQVPISGSDSSKGPSALCLLKSPRGSRITVQLHKLDAKFGGAADKWADDFLSARLTPLGDGLLGMASDSQAWLAVPDGCAGRPNEFEGPLVIDVDTGWISDQEVETEARDQLARTVVKLVNGYMANEGCSGTISDPVGQMPKPPSFQEEKPDEICGIKGLHFARARKHSSSMVTSGTGPVRTCDRNMVSDHPELRLMTVEDPRLSALYTYMAIHSGEKVKAIGDDIGYGFIRDDFGLLQTDCQLGTTTFLIRANRSDYAADIRTLLPRYVSAEANRLGCGPVRIKLPA